MEVISKEKAEVRLERLVQVSKGISMGAAKDALEKITSLPAEADITFCRECPESQCWVSDMIGFCPILGRGVSANDFCSFAPK